ncbi:MAG TPA: hypothetical protein VHL34_22095 [Rhizomicrobium sp.]|nr:hypothetical protein [Rhizomicrobium sp.]
MLLRFALAALLFASPAAASGHSDTLAQYQAAMQAGDAALKANQIAEAKKNFETARTLAPQIPQPYLKLAHIAADAGDKTEAIARLGDYAGMNKLLDLDAEFASLKTAPGYAALAARFKQNALPLCRCKPVWHGKPDDFFIAEGLAKDGDRLFVASVKSRRIVVIANNTQTDFATLPGTLAPFGILADRTHSRLLVSAAELRGGGAAPEHNALLTYDLKTGALLETIEGPKGAQIGDLALALDGTIYLSDSNGALLRRAPGAQTLEEISHDLISPQGMVVSADGKTLLVADYSAGLILFDPASRKLTPVVVPQGLTTITMDGLAQLSDGTFVATQNNIAPVRIIHFALSKDWSHLAWLKLLAVNAPNASDLSLITNDGQKAYAVGIAQWSSLAENAVDMTPPLHPWEIIELMP